MPRKDGRPPPEETGRVIGSNRSRLSSGRAAGQPDHGERRWSSGQKLTPVDCWDHFRSLGFRELTELPTVKQLPISKGIAGVSMRLEPGVMRELHWHATAAEWAYVITGRVHTTVVDPQGRTGIDDFGPGDIWYFPRGHGHMLQCLGNEPCHFILVFDNGYF